MKKLVLLLLSFLLLGCSSNPSITSTTSQNESFKPFTYKTKICEYNFYGLDKSLSNSYSDHVLKIEENSHFLDEEETETNYALIDFDNVSSQTAIPGYPIINAYNKSSSEIRYVTLLSSSTFDIDEVSILLSLWSKRDKNNVPDDYYIGLEYLKNDTWFTLDSLDINDITIGSINDDKPFTFNIEESGIRNIRLAFDFTKATGNIRFALYSLNLKGEQFVIIDNPNIQGISFEEDELIISEKETINLNLNVTSSDKNKYVEYISSDRSIATVNEEGVVTAVSSGEVTITARNGDFEDSINIIVIKENQNYKKIIQNLVSFNGDIPNGFVSNFNSYFSGTYLNFKEQGNYVLTTTYENITGPTVVVLNMMLSTAADIDLSSENIFTVEGLNSENEVIEKVQKTNLINTSLEDIEFEFISNEIIKYRLVFEYKHYVDYGTYSKTGKNYCLNNLIIYQK